MNWKKWSARLLLAIGLPLTVLLTAEGILHLVSWGWPTSFTIPSVISGHSVRIDNQFFGFRFFPPALVRTPAPLMLQTSPTNDAIRIAVLGESAAMGEPLPEYGLTRILQIILETRHPSRRFEVINAAMTAIDSQVIREIAGDLCELHPDAIIIYAGNNEVIGPNGPGTAWGAAGQSALLARTRVLFSRTRFSQLLKTLIPVQKKNEKSTWAGMEMFKENVTADDPRLRPVYENFRRNLAAIVKKAHRNKSAVILSSMAVNLKDCAPFSDLEECRRAYAQGRQAARSNQWEAAMQAFSRARDLDALRFRADSTINRIIRETAQTFRKEVALVDLETYIAVHSDQGIPGKDLFLDHVHFNFEGNRLAASRLADAVEQALHLPPDAAAHEPSAEECARLLFYTPWSEYEMVSSMIERYSRPPFSMQEENASNLNDWRAQQNDLRQIVKQRPVDSFRSAALERMQRHPEDSVYPAEWGKILLAENRRPEAGFYFDKALERAPHRYDLRGLAAMVKSLQGQPDEGLRIVKGAEKDNPLTAQTLIQCGRQLSDYGRLPEAARFLAAALSIAPDHAEASLQLAGCEARQGRPGQAEKLLRQALRKHPRDDRLYKELIALLLFQQRNVEAEALLQEAEPEMAQNIRRQLGPAIQ
ncbi:MAG TPA: hypothetical protein DCZ95_17005 [Verrucomicrobia bacterium]|nr:MAG: hypothetical protein A2X46_09495 [Lentisphaerae bacterium GWF2_57_35]HBA85784.1 hypothetical protein [Verrucomicrobiota bacterium]